jgi:predicted alpha/beta hydrolase family esterase
MTTYLLLHGSYGNVYENWLPWLFRELSSDGHNCITPFFLSPQHQDFYTWSQLMNYYRGLGQITTDTVFIAHSSGCPFATKYLVSNSINIKALITVSGFNNFLSGMDDFDKINKPFFMEQDELRKVQNFVNQAFAFYSDNDPYLPKDILETFANSIGASPILVKGAGHFNADAGYLEFPEMLKVLKTLK